MQKEIKSVLVCADCPDCEKEVPIKLKAKELEKLRNWMIFDLHLAVFYRNLFPIAFSFVFSLLGWAFEVLSGATAISYGVSFVFYGSIGAFIALTVNLIMHYREFRQGLTEMQIELVEEVKPNEP